MKTRKRGHGNIFRRYLPTLGRYCYGVTHHEVLFVIFDFLSTTPAIDGKNFSPRHVGGLLYLAALDESFEKCGRIDWAGNEASEWKKAIPVSYHIIPLHFRKGPKGEDLYETYNYGDVEGIPKYVTKEEISRLGIFPRLFLGERCEANDDEKLLLDIVRSFRTLDESSASSMNPEPDEEIEDPPEEIITIRFSVAIDQIDSKLTSDPETLSELCDGIEEALFEAGQDTSGPTYEPATVGQELDGELFWIVEVFTETAKAAQATEKSISKLLRKRLGGAKVGSEIIPNV